MKTSLVFAFAAAVLVPTAHAAPPAKPTMQQVLDASAPGDWRSLVPEDTLYLDLPAGRVVIELAPTFAPLHVANIRALGNGQNLAKTLQMVREFREDNQTTPIVLMGYFNPIHHYGVPRFIEDAKAAGVDGLIVVDLPPEHNADLCDPAQAAGLDFIRLTTPTTDDARLPVVLNGSSGFVYYVSVAGVTGAGLVAWLYGGIGVDTFLARLQSVITWKHFAVGLIKAPFMAFVIGLIASIEGLAVKGSAESLGRQVTGSVVKSIFMVIVVDGLFAMFFAAIEY